MTGRPRSSFQGPVRLPGGQLVDVTAAIFGPNDDFVCSDELSSGPGLIVFTRHWAEQRVVGCIKHLINAKKTERCAGISSDPVLVCGNQVWTQLNISHTNILVLRSGVGKALEPELNLRGIRSAVSILIGSNLVNNIGATSHSIHCFGVHFLQVGPKLIKWKSYCIKYWKVATETLNSSVEHLLRLIKSFSQDFLYNSTSLERSH